jgi:hypothetical protein
VIGLAVLVLAALVVVSYPVARDYLEVRQLVAGLVDGDPEVRAKSCYRLASYDSAVGVEALYNLLEAEQDPEVCESAGYALQKLGEQRALEVMPAAIARLPDCAALSKLIGYYARLGGATAAERVEELSRCGQVWREMGAGLGLLELNDVRGAAVLLRYAAADEPEVREFAAQFLRRFCEPMMEIVGEPMDLSTPQERGFSTEQLAGVTEWWSRRDRTRELRDFNQWTREDAPAWHELKRLIHARERASRWLGLSD